MEAKKCYGKLIISIPEIFGVGNPGKTGISESRSLTEQPAEPYAAMLSEVFKT